MVNNDCKKSIGIVVMAFVFVFAMVLSSFTTAVAAPELTRQEDESLILRIAMQDDVKTTNPLVGGDVWTWNVIGYLYESPINTDEAGNIIPYIAVGTSSQTTKTDPTTYTWDDCTIGEFEFTPNEGGTQWQPNSEVGETTVFYDFTDVYWHDGTQVTVRDVLFSYAVQSQLPDWVSSVKCLMDQGGEATSNFPNDHKLFITPVWESANGLQAALLFQLQTPFADFFRNTLSAFLLPSHIWGGTAGNQDSNNRLIWLDPQYTPTHAEAWDDKKATAWDNPSPVGCGPFEWDSWTPGVSSKIITYREHFYRVGFQYDIIDPDTDKGQANQPTINAMVFTIFKTAEQAVLALRNNEVDYIAWSIPPTFVQDLMNEQDISIMQSAEKGFFYLAYNMRKEMFGYDHETHVDEALPFRKAVAHCIDKQTIVQRLLQNFGLPADGPVSSISEWYNNSIPTYAFDPAEARNILWEAGYRPMNGGDKNSAGPDNWWEAPTDKFPKKEIGSEPDGLIRILTPPADYDPIRAQAGIMMATQLQAVGIYAESIPMDFGTIVNHIEERDFDMYILGWRIGSDPTDFLYAFFHSSTAKAGQNYPGYQNTTFDGIIDHARETGDETERMQDVKDAQAAIAYDLPYDVLYYRTNIEAYRNDRFTGWSAGATGSIYNWGSILNLKPPSNKWLNAKFMNTGSSYVSNSTYDEPRNEIQVQVTAVVKDPTTGALTRTPVPDAKVIIDVSNGTFGPLELQEFNDTTDDNGIIKIGYNAPYVPKNGSAGFIPEYEDGVQALLNIKEAILEGYDQAPGKVTLIKIYPEDVNFLSVVMSATPDVVDDKDEAGQAGLATITVEVTDQDGFQVQDATVIVQVDPAEPTITPTEATTDQQGKATFTFTADDIDEDKVYTLSALALKATYKDGDQSISINVINYKPADGGSAGTPFPSFLIVASIFSVVAVSVAVFRRIRA